MLKRFLLMLAVLGVLCGMGLSGCVDVDDDDNGLDDDTVEVDD